MAHPNEDLTRRGFDAFGKGDVDTLRELFDQDAVWHVPGRSQLSGDHRGMDAILGNFAKTAELTGGTSASTSTTSWPTTSMRSQSMSLAASARGEPWRPGTCS